MRIRWRAVVVGIIALAWCACLALVACGGGSAEDAPALASDAQADAVAIDSAAVAPGRFELSVSTKSIVLIEGASAKVTVEVVPGQGFADDVRLSASALPAGLKTNAGGVVIKPAERRIDVIITAPAKTRHGPARVTIRGTAATAASVTASVEVDVDVRGASGSLDTSFGDGGVAVTPLPGPVNVSDLVLTSDDRAVVTGGVNIFTPTTASNSFAFARYTANGAPDPSFGDAGVVISNPGDAFGAQAVASVRPPGTDDLIAVGGGYVMRLRKDGSRETTFGDNGVVTVGDEIDVKGLFLRATNQIVLAGGGNPSSPKVVQLTSAGAPDPAFGVGGAVQGPGISSPLGAAIDPASGDVILVGVGCRILPISQNGTAGTETSTLGNNCYAWNALVDPTGRRLLVGADEKPDSGGGGFPPLFTAVVGAFLPDGGLVSSFGDGGYAAPVINELSASAFSAMAVDSDGRYVAVGLGFEGGFHVVRIKRDGTLDKTFAGVGFTTTGPASQADAKRVAIQKDGRIVVAGTFSAGMFGSVFGIARFWP